MQSREVINIWNQLHLIPEDMRGIGIQISRLEIYRTKQAKSSLINFFNKTKNQQTCDKMLEDDNKDRCVSNEKSKPDCSKVPLTTESSLAIKRNCDTEINNLPLESAKSESTGVAIPVNVKVESSTFVGKPKNKKLHDPKINENISKMKNLLGKSNKKAIQRQTSQENFFKQVKPNSGRSLKYEIPRIQDIDMSVLIELPSDIRNEIFDEYKRNKKRVALSTSTVDPTNEIPHDEESSNIQNCSQVDPDVLSALMENDLHPDVQRDVEMYCDMKREANRVNVKKTNEKNDSERLRETDASSKISNKKENTLLIVNSTCVDKAERIPQENMQAMHAGDQLYEKHDTVKATSTSYQINHVDTLHNNVTMDKADTFILQNLSILHNNENVDKHQEMLINLVNHLFTLPLQQVPHKLFR